MLNNSLRDFFYTLHSKDGVPRKMADAMCWTFMKTVKASGIKPPFDRTPLTLVSHKYKFIYIGIPKVATRSFRTTFYDQKSLEYGSVFFETKRGFENIVNAYPDYFKFSFVRNPYARILSCYNSKIGHKDLSLLKQARIMSFYKELEAGMSFEHFATWLNISEGKDECADRHWMSQHKFLFDKNGKAICDFIGRHETLQDDLKTVMEQIGAPLPELETAGWISDSSDYKPHYTQKAKELITKRYKKDLELFDYKF